jgi:hypothetical protein
MILPQDFSKAWIDLRRQFQKHREPFGVKS